jgi:hypothetical protein
VNAILSKAESIWKEGLPIRSITAHNRGHGKWDVQFVIELMLGHYDEPRGTLRGWERYPDQHVEALASEEGIEEIMRQVAEAGHSVDLVRFDGSLPQYPQFMTKPVKWYRK